MTFYEFIIAVSEKERPGPQFSEPGLRCCFPVQFFRWQGESLAPALYLSGAGPISQRE